FLRLIVGGNFPKVYGIDLSGVALEVGSGVTGFSTGDSIYGTTPVYLRRQGSIAEKISVPVKYLRKMPAGLTHEQAASLPVAALAALDGFRQCGDVAGKSVLVNGA